MIPVTLVKAPREKIKSGTSSVRTISYFRTTVCRKDRTMIHYLKNKVGVVDFANAQGVVIFWAFVKSTL